MCLDRTGSSNRVADQRSGRRKSKPKHVCTHAVQPVDGWTCVSQQVVHHCTYTVELKRQGNWWTMHVRRLWRVGPPFFRLINVVAQVGAIESGCFFCLPNKRRIKCIIFSAPYCWSNLLGPQKCHAFQNWCVQCN
jgi:hypothetical protein